MNNEVADPRAYARLLALAALLGLISAIITFAFVASVQMGQSLI